MRAGFTLLEVIIAGALLAVVGAKIGLVLNATAETTNKSVNELDLEDQALRVLDQIAYAVMGSDRESLFPGGESPLFDSELNYTIHLGVSAGEVIVSAPERIGLDVDEDGKLFWKRNPDAEEELRVVWSSLVSEYLEGELPNGLDDNGNGVIDEDGLVFTLQGDLIHIMLTLERYDSQGERIVRFVETRATCRN